MSVVVLEFGLQEVKILRSVGSEDEPHRLDLASKRLAVENGSVDSKVNKSWARVRMYFQLRLPSTSKKDVAGS